MSATRHDPTAPRGRKPAMVRGLLWREWLLHGNLILNALALWLICSFVVLAFFHPGSVLAFGVIYAIIAGATFGGSEAMEGSEEFSFSLPPTRADRYVVRLLCGLTTVLGFTIFGILTVAFDVPQRLWGLVVTTGYTDPFPPCTASFLYPLAVLLPYALFGTTFAFAAVASSRGIAQVAWFNGTLAVGVVLGLGFLSEKLLWDKPNGIIASPAVAIFGTVLMAVGYLAYERKEGISRPSPVAQARSSWGWVIAVILLLLVLFLFMLIPVSTTPVVPPPRFTEPERLEEPDAVPIRTIGPIQENTLPVPKKPLILQQRKRES